MHTLLITAERSLISPGNFRFKVLVNHRNYSRWNTTNMHVSSHILAIITPYSQMIINSAKEYLHLPYKVFRKKQSKTKETTPQKPTPPIPPLWFALPSPFISCERIHFPILNGWRPKGLFTSTLLHEMQSLQAGDSKLYSCLTQLKWHNLLSLFSR